MQDAKQLLFMIQNAATAAQEALDDEHEGNFTFYVHHLALLSKQLQQLVKDW